jgi:hypothetical protein
MALVVHERRVDFIPSLCTNVVVLASLVASRPFTASAKPPTAVQPIAL